MGELTHKVKTVQNETGRYHETETRAVEGARTNRALADSPDVDTLQEVLARPHHCRFEPLKERSKRRFFDVASLTAGMLAGAEKLVDEMALGGLGHGYPLNVQRARNAVGNDKSALVWIE